jgi:hypothetical protein
LSSKYPVLQSLALGGDLLAPRMNSRAAHEFAGENMRGA